jgi:hypothetical protein
MEKVKLNLNQEILSISGKPFPYPEGNLTIKMAIKIAITNADMDKKTPDEKYNAYKTAMRIEKGETDFLPEEWSSFKRAVGLVFGPEIVGFVWDAIAKV